MKKFVLAIVVVSAVSSFAHAGGEFIIDTPDCVAGWVSGRGICDSPIHSVSDVSLHLTMLPTAATGFTASISHPNRKILVQAREDINYFVASDGAVRTARFNQAMEIVREEIHDQQSSDMELAQALLAEI